MGAHNQKVQFTHLGILLYCVKIKCHEAADDTETKHAGPAMIRAICLIGGLTGAVGLSQFPEYSQQYMQRLGGQVDELTRDIKQLDAMALDLRVGREERLEQMAEVPTFAPDAAHWRAKIARHARLSADMALLRDATPMQRLSMPYRLADPQTAQAVWADFTPAVPFSTAGVASAGAGFLGGWAILAALFAVLAAPFRRIKSKPAATPKRADPVVRADPPVSRPTLVAEMPNNRPRLAGAQR